MFYVFLLIIGIVGVGIYLLFVMQLVPGAAEERLGVLEPLPPDLGTWKVDAESPEAAAAEREGLQREVRFFYQEQGGLFSQGRLLKQVRYRNRTTNSIERVDPDEVIKRKRIRA